MSCELGLLIGLLFAPFYTRYYVQHVRLRSERKNWRNVKNLFVIQKRSVVGRNRIPGKVKKKKKQLSLLWGHSNKTDLTTEVTRRNRARWFVTSRTTRNRRLLRVQYGVYSPVHSARQTARGGGKTEKLTVSHWKRGRDRNRNVTITRKKPCARGARIKLNFIRVDDTPRSQRPGSINTEYGRTFQSGHSTSRRTCRVGRFSVIRHSRTVPSRQRRILPLGNFSP